MENMIENKDILKKYLAHNKTVRVFILDATNMVKNLRKIHNMSNTSTAALGRTLIISCIMASMLKEKEDRITVQIKGEGPIGNMVVCGNNSLKMKAYATNPQADAPKKKNGKLNVSEIVGKGYINVVKDIGLKDPYVGVCKLVSSEIAEDFAYYFAVSEQTPTAVFLGVNFSKQNQIEKACGYVIEPLPDCSDKIINLIEKINSNISSVTNLMLDISDIDDVAKTITGDNLVKCIEEKVPLLKCDCNMEKIKSTLIALGEKEVKKIVDENDGKIELSCDFCNKSYVLGKKEIEKLFEY